MLISIVIPTRERAEVLRHALASCTRIIDPDLEIVVSDNASQDDTSAVVAANADSRIRYLRTPRRCSMRENFEFAVSNARGDYVIIIGDDDGLIPNQFAYLRAVLAERRPDSFVGSVVTYDWPGDSAPATNGRLKLLYKSTYGGLSEMSGAQLRAELRRVGAGVVADTARIYGGVVSRGVIEKMKARSGQLFMASSPDIYFMFAAPAMIERHVVMHHPFFISGTSARSNGASYHQWLRGDGPADEFKKYVEEVNSDPVLDPLPSTPSLQACLLSQLEAANVHAYGGSLQVDYEREFERTIQSLGNVDERLRAHELSALARLATERGLPARLQDESLLAARCAPRPKQRRNRRRAAVRGYVAADRVVFDVIGRGPTDIDAAAAHCERLLGVRHPETGLGRLAAWAGLVRRAVAAPAQTSPAQP